MKRNRLLALLGAGLLSGCIWMPGPGGPGLVVPPLPALVVLDLEPYYFHGGFHYYYHSDQWSYARTRNGPWVALPRDLYPREVRWKNRETQPWPK